MLSHIVIEAIRPAIGQGAYPVKRTVGDRFTVEADIFRDGHALLRAAVKWRRIHDGEYAESPMHPLGPEHAPKHAAEPDAPHEARPAHDDRWRGSFLLRDNTRYLYTVEAWTDEWASWLVDFRKKAQAGREVRSDLLEGLSLLEAAHARAEEGDRVALGELLADLWRRLRAFDDPALSLPLLQATSLAARMARLGARAGLCRHEPPLELVVDRERARYSTWYELFPRSQGPAPGVHGTLRDAELRLPYVADLGFDVLYLPPIHPIGHTHRKGRNNAERCQPGDPGSPWAIGSEAGGHDAIEPALGTLADFDHFVAAAARHGIEIALDFAVQCSPDHPWVREHPEWFLHRPDGSIKYAENPPKEYQDIHPLDFDTADPRGLMNELRRIVLFWVARGVRIFRVDNPHTKPVSFWQWLIAEIQAVHPDVIFLAEAFTRPKMMRALAKAGFTQSYTYFTWRNTKHELTEYLSELAHSEMKEYFRPNFFANTPDILPFILQAGLQAGGRAAFALRLVLAATLSPSYGIYSGFELCENAALPGREEYLDSEKYELKARDWNRPGHVKELVARVNAIRRHNPALQRLDNLQFLPADNENILFYRKASADGLNTLLIAVNLDPFHAHECTVRVPAEAVGVRPGQSYRVEDLLDGEIYSWAEWNYVHLDPRVRPAHIFLVET